MLRSAIAVIVMVAAGAANAQTAIPPAKKQLVEKVLQLWPVEALGESMLQKPVAEAMGQARVVIQGRVSPEKQEAALKEIAADAKKFMEDNTPLVRNSAQKIVTTTVVPMLAEKFSEDELRQIIAILESPMKRKFEEFTPQVQKVLGEKLAAETGSQVNAKLDDFNQRVGTRLRAATTP